MTDLLMVYSWNQAVWITAQGSQPANDIDSEHTHGSWSSTACICTKKNNFCDFSVHSVLKAYVYMVNIQVWSYTVKH